MLACRASELWSDFSATSLISRLFMRHEGLAAARRQLRSTEAGTGLRDKSGGTRHTERDTEKAINRPHDKRKMTTIEQSALDEVGLPAVPMRH